MSLLNDMLKDLDQNKKGNKQSLFVTNSSQMLSFSFPTVSLWVLFPIIMGIVFLSIFYFMRLNHFPIANTTTAPPSVKTTPMLKSYVAATPEFSFPSYIATLPNHPWVAIEAPPPTITKIFSQLSGREWHDEQLNLALESIKEGNDFEATVILNHLIEKFPESINARESLISLYLNQQDFERARLMIDEGLALSPRSLSLNMQKAHLLFAQEKNEAALDLLNPFHPNINKEPDFYGLKAAILEALGHNKEADMIYQFLVKIEPTNGKYWFGYALGLEHKHATIQAIAAYKQALESIDLDPEIQDYAIEKIKTLQG